MMEKLLFRESYKKNKQEKSPKITIKEYGKKSWGFIFNLLNIFVMEITISSLLNNSWLIIVIGAILLGIIMSILLILQTGKKIEEYNADPRNNEKLIFMKSEYFSYLILLRAILSNKATYWIVLQTQGVILNVQTIVLFLISIFLWILLWYFFLAIPSDRHYTKLLGISTEWWKHRTKAFSLLIFGLAFVEIFSIVGLILAMNNI